MVELIDELVEEFRPYIAKLARWVYNKTRKLTCVSIEDLESAGFIGLIQACERYVDNDTASFRTFAGHRIKGVMLDETRHMGRLRRSTGKYEGEQMGFADIKLENMPDGSVVDFLEVLPSKNVYYRPDRKDVLNDVNAALRELSFRDRLIVDLHFAKGMRMHEVGEALGVSEPTISIRLKAVHEALREPLSVYGSNQGDHNKCQINRV